MNKTRAHWGFVYKTVTDLAYAPDSQISFSSRKKKQYHKLPPQTRGEFISNSLFYLKDLPSRGKGGGRKISRKSQFPKKIMLANNAAGPIYKPIIKVMMCLRFIKNKCFSI